MLLFRSEEHIDRWSGRTGIPRGESFSLEQGWKLATALYADRMSPNWRRKTAQEYQAMFANAGLTSSFWKIA